MSTTSKKIMIAYADRSRVFDLGKKCRGLGLEVVGVHNADTALWFLKNERPELVCLDAEMQTADGVSLCEKIAADEELAFVPIIVMQDAAPDEAVRYPSLCTHVVDRSNDPWSQLKPLLIDLLQLTPQPAAAPLKPAVIEPEVSQTLSQSVYRLDRAVEQLEHRMRRPTGETVRPSPARVDAVFDEIARGEEASEASVETPASEHVKENVDSHEGFTRTDKTPSKTVIFPMASTAPRVFAPPQVQ